LGFHGEEGTRSLETLKPAQARGEDIQTSDTGAEVDCEGACASCRASISQPRGQHAHGIESFEEENREEASGKEDRTQTFRQEDCTQTFRQEDCKESVSEESSKKVAAGAREKDPKGGLTAAGRRAFARRDGSHLKPGVTKSLSEMTPQDMRRKGSWAVRFYGRAKLPALVDDRGRPTRHALSAHAWGEPVPRTVAAARRIAAKGERLLQRYHRIRQKT
jgi:hypothetical protein